MDFAIGDIVRGERFPASDGRGLRAHYGIVTALGRDGVATVILGTSVKARARVSSREYFVLSRDTCRSEADWDATGLVKPTLFDFGAALKLHLLPSRCTIFGVSKVGTAKGKLLAWARRYASR